MYAKVFEQIFDSSISEDHVVRHAFMDLLVLANKHGEIDMTLKAISRRTNVPLDIIERAVSILCQPDPSSRTATEDGRRLILMDEHRDWGWKIVNFAHYNAMRNEDSRREYFREYKAKWRANKKTSTMSTVDKIESTVSPPESTVSTHVYVPVDISTKEEKGGLPDWVPLQPWLAFLASCAQRGKPLLGESLRATLQTLSELRDQGNDSTAVLVQATAGGHCDLIADRKRQKALTPHPNATVGMARQESASNEAQRKREQVDFWRGQRDKDSPLWKTDGGAFAHLVEEDDKRRAIQ